MDVKTTFLNGDLEEDVDMFQTKGFIVKGKEKNVYILVKDLYGEKQASHEGYEKLTKLESD